MTQTNTLTTEPIQPASLVKRMVVGAVIGLALILFFLLSVDEPNPAWGNLWMLRPLIIVPLAGATGGLCNYFILLYHKQVGIHRIAAVIVSLLVFTVGLWLGVVLGLDGTMWD